MRLYHHPFSSNARRARMTAIHLGVDLELEVVDLGKGAQRAPAFLAKNPNAKVPVLEDDGFYLTESHAIMQYLADKAANDVARNVYPTELRARADVNRWLFWNSHHFAPAVGILNWERNVKKMLGLGGADPARAQHGEEEVTKLAKILDEHLATKAWLSGSGVTLADLAVASPLMAERSARLPVADLSHLQSWFGRVQQLDAWKQTAL